MDAFVCGTASDFVLGYRLVRFRDEGCSRYEIASGSPVAAVLLLELLYCLAGSCSDCEVIF
jgi:hypothetical protein